MKIVSNYILLIASLVLLLSSCRDEDFYVVDKGNNVPEGETEITASLSFTSFYSALDGARGGVGGAPGTAISSIESLNIFIYEETDEEIKNDDGTTSKVWKLEENGNILITGADHSLKVENPGADRPDVNGSQETATAHATFRFRHKNGVYKIYAVANVDFSDVKTEDIDTPEKLKGYNLRWYRGTENVAKNSGMFGYFTNDKNAPVNSTEIVEVSPSLSLHAQIRRAASKVTIAYDGSGLADGVEIYILTATIKDIPVKCPLGLKNEPDTSTLLISQGDTILYHKNSVDLPNPEELKFGEYEACVTKQSPNYGSDHTVSAEALYFYENMQGKGKSKAQTAPGYGNDEGKQSGIGFPNPDKDTPGSGWKDDKPFGTYIEVEAYYRNRTEQSSGRIKYRFMLGKDTDTNYDAERNYHYKLTLNFKGYANDYDWHIDYVKPQIFEVSDPEVFNYAGKVFVPDYFWPNGMHNFVPENPITVTSYLGDVNDELIGFYELKDVKLDYDDKDYEWLDYTVEQGAVPYQKNFVFTVKPEALEVDDEYVVKFNINDKISSGTGTEDNPINLADLNRRQIKEFSGITCTANCYMVDADGWYILPLVYGNAIHNGKVIESSFKPGFEAESETETAPDNILQVFKNYNNDNITSPYIEKDLDLYSKVDNIAPFLVWQDADKLVDYSTWWAPNTKMIYVPNAFYDVDNKKVIGGLKFQVLTKQQGNSVIAIGEKTENTGTVLVDRNLPAAFWSWHIWVTSLDKQLDENDKTIEVQGHDSKRKFKFMPVNLGWCSEPDEDIIYYKERRCTVTFTVKDKDGKELSISKDIVKKSHIALSRGYNPYYQWGRKDPFPPAEQNDEYHNRKIWMSEGWSYQQNPQPMTTYTDAGNGVHEGLVTGTAAEKRIHTRDALGYRIKYPYAWHNPPREKGAPGSGYDFVSINETYVNLWEGRPGVNPDADILKTIYDPCPVGYQVPHINAFSGFTTSGLDSSNKPEWYDVITDNILNYDSSAPGGGPYVEMLYEFYTTPEKLQSIIFPENGYRDWDGNGNIYQYAKIGYAWAAGNKTQEDRQFFNFEFAHNDKNTSGLDPAYIRPRNVFFSCDGFPVRPVSNGNHGTNATP